MENINKESLDILNDYILELKSKGRAEKTIKQYRWDILHFLEYAKENYNNKSILELKKRDFRNFFLYMQEEGKSSARINRMQSSLRAWLTFIEEDDEEYPDYTRNPMRKIRSLEKQPVKEIVFLTDEQVTFLINYLLENNKTQKALFVSLAYDSLGRKNELLQVEKHSFYNPEERSTNIVTGKRGKRFRLMYANRTQEIASKWLQERGEDDIDSLWISYYNGKARALTYETLYAWAVSFRSILESKYEKDIPLGVHSMRHTGADLYSTGEHHSLQYMGKEKLTINEIRILMNHESIETSQSYLKNRDEEILNKLFKNE